MATPEQERQWIAELDKRSVETVRRMRAQGEISPAFVFVTEQWLSDKEREAKRRREASNSEQIEIARRASDAAERAAAEAARASTAAERAATATERQAVATEGQAVEARRANTRATIALIISIISAVVTTISIAVTHFDAHK